MFVVVNYIVIQEQILIIWKYNSNALLTPEIFGAQYLMFTTAIGIHNTLRLFVDVVARVPVSVTARYGKLFPYDFFNKNNIYNCVFVDQFII